MSCKIKINYQTNYVRNDRGKFSELIVSVFFFFLPWNAENTEIREDLCNLFYFSSLLVKM